MEVSIFPLFREYLNQFVSIHLNTDPPSANPDYEKNTQYQLRLTQTSARPTYAIVDPNEPYKALDLFVGADLPSGKRFGEFLKRNLTP